LFARPKPPRRNYQRYDGGEQASATPYRDRARERREGINVEYADSERILATLENEIQVLTDKHAEEYDSETASKLARSEIEARSKMLGGDIEHTHLVKGLDFALLEKVRRDMERQAAESAEEKDAPSTEDAATTSLNANDKPPKKESVTFHTGLARNIYNIAMQIAQPPPIPQSNELFRPGRMAYRFPLDVTHPDGSKTVSDAWAIPTAVIRSKAEEQLHIRGSSSLANDLVLKKVCDVVYELREGRRHHDEPTTSLPAPPPSSSPQPEQTMTFDDDMDIFADAGRDYQCAVGTDDELDKEQVDMFGESTAMDTDTLGPELGPELGPMLGPEMDKTSSRPSVATEKRRYFEDEDEDMITPRDVQPTTSVQALINSATHGLSKNVAGTSKTNALRRRLSSKPAGQLGFEVEDRDAIDYETYGLGVGDGSEWTAQSKLAATVAAEQRRERLEKHAEEILDEFAGMGTSGYADLLESDDATTDHLADWAASRPEGLWPSKEEREREAALEKERERERLRQQRLRKSRKFNRDAQIVNEIMEQKFGHGLGNLDEDDGSRKKRRRKQKSPVPH
jgi:hypothetical protein